MSKNYDQTDHERNILFKQKINYCQSTTHGHHSR